MNLDKQLLIKKKDSETPSLLQEIDKWEIESINKIEQTADECRQILIKYTNKYVTKVEDKLNNLARQVKEVREENEFIEIDLNQLNEKF
jgi:hypothetical protein